jgi:hypothetical protein
MASLQNQSACPKCHSDAHVVRKALLIGAQSPKAIFKEEYGERAGYRRRDQIAVDELKPEVLQNAPLEQFVIGFYCESCGIGFIPDSFASESG